MFIITSNGLSQGHPRDGAYQNFKTSPRLKKVTKHKVLVAESKKEWFMHETQNAIFSTLTNGTMSIVLEEGKEVVLTSEKQKTIVELNYGSKKDKKEKIILQEEDDDKFIFSPLPKKIQQKRIQKNKAKVIKSHNFNEEKKKLTYSNESEESNQKKSQIKKRKDREESSKSSKKPKKEKFFTYTFEQNEIQFREKEVFYDGDCGYSALGTNRKAATELLLKNIHREVIRKLIAPEIYDMLPQLPDNHPVVQLKAYQLNLSQQDIIAGPYQRICNRLNNLFQRKEGERWSGDQLWEWYQQNLLDIQQHTQKNEAYKTFIAIREQIRKNEKERMQFCSQQKTVECYIENFMQIPVHTYYDKYGDNNWLNYCPILMNDGKYRTYAINAVAYLLNKNLVIIHESGEVRHKYKFSVMPMTLNNTLFLRHIGNYHFNTLIPEDK